MNNNAKLRDLQKRLGWTNDELAEYIPTSNSMVSNMRAEDAEVKTSLIDGLRMQLRDKALRDINFVDGLGK